MNRLSAHKGPDNFDFIDEIRFNPEPSIEFSDGKRAEVCVLVLGRHQVYAQLGLPRIACQQRLLT